MVVVVVGSRRLSSSGSNSSSSSGGGGGVFFVLKANGEALQQIGWTCSFRDECKASPPAPDEPKPVVSLQEGKPEESKLPEVPQPEVSMPEDLDPVNLPLPPSTPLVVTTAPAASSL